MCEEKRVKICLIKAENAVNNDIMDKFSNEKQADFRLFNLCDRFFKGFHYIDRRKYNVWNCGIFR